MAEVPSMLCLIQFLLILNMFLAKVLLICRFLATFDLEGVFLVRTGSKNGGYVSL